jgi:two-component system, LytTR family, response regulator
MSAVYKSIIIDDEELARADLKAVLKDFSSVEIIGEADNYADAKELIERSSPDLIFLDIQMPNKSGFELLKDVKTEAKIIFVTAYDEYAIKAFEVNAQDYLLKPVNKDRLALALEHINIPPAEDSAQKKFTAEDNIFLMVNNTYHFIRIDSIIKISSAGNYSEIFTSANIKGFVLKTMREWETRLPKNLFVRIHRYSIINLGFIDHIEEWFNYSYQIYLKGIEKPLVMSRRFAAKLKDKMC